MGETTSAFESETQFSFAILLFRINARNFGTRQYMQ